MRIFANIIWHFPFFGFISALLTFILGGLLVITILGAPIGFGLIQLSFFLLTPFSKEMVSRDDLEIQQNKIWKTYGFIIRILYFPFGLLLALIVMIQIGLLFLTIIGIPVALVLAKSLSTYFNPVNKKCVPRIVASEIEKKKMKKYQENL